MPSPVLLKEVEGLGASLELRVLRWFQGCFRESWIPDGLGSLEESGGTQERAPLISFSLMNHKLLDLRA